ncbi:MAG: hypothetical protein JSV91_02575 [Phycisphaerales bacterium]|nr:MAG: hypothetical protein JSV91_02575 [Phycisphaerales bacterium]
MWIDRIVGFEPEARLVAIKNVSLAEEHLHDHFPAAGGHDALPIMPASLMIEGMAQTAGILVGSVTGFKEKVILAKIVRAEIEKDVFPGQTIRYDARLEAIQAAGASTTGIVERRTYELGTASGDKRGENTCESWGGWERIGRIDLMFSHIDQNLSGLQFPEENFVFSDNFRTVLRTAGLGNLAGE